MLVEEHAALADVDRSGESLRALGSIILYSRPMTPRRAWTIAGLACAALVGVLAFRGLSEPEHPQGPPPPRSASGDGFDLLDSPEALDPFDGEPVREGSGRDPVERLCQALACEPAQREAVERAIEGYARRAAELREEIKDLRAPLDVLLQAEAPDDAAVRAVAGDLAEPRRALDEAALAAILAMHAVLGPAQRQRLARMVVRRGPVAVLEGTRKRGQGASAVAD